MVPHITFSNGVLLFPGLHQQTHTYATLVFLATAYVGIEKSLAW